MVIVETSIFTRIIQELLNDEDYAEFQIALSQRPDMGNLIPGSGGLRKVRWRISSKGKRGGLRIIYYWLTQDAQILMLYAYTKSRLEDLSKSQLAALREIAGRWENGKKDV